MVIILSHQESLQAVLTEIDGKKYIFEVIYMPQNTKVKYIRAQWCAIKRNGISHPLQGSLYKSGWRKYSGNYYYLKECVVQTKSVYDKVME